MLSKLPPFQGLLLVLSADVAVHHALSGRWLHGGAVIAIWASGCGLDLALRRRGWFGPTSVLALRLALCLMILAYWWRTEGHVQSIPLTVLLLSVPAAFLTSTDIRERLTVLVGPALLCASLLGALIALDAMLTVKALIRPTRTQAPTKGYWSTHPILGYHAPAGTYHALVMRDDAVVYDVTYNFDDSLRRVTVDSDSSVKPSEHIVLAGGSFMMGEGVQDNEHLGSQIAMRTQRYRVYNYGFSGYGPQQLLALVESGILAREIAEPEGALVYGLLLPDHNDRVLGTYTTLRWAARGPHYRLTAAGPRSEGSFREADSFRVRLYDALRTTRSLDFLAGRVDQLLSPNRSTELMESVLLASARGYLEQFPGGKVVFLVWPGPQRIPSSQEHLIDALRSAGHSILDLRQVLGGVLAADATIPGDGHPRPWVYARAAESVLELLESDISRVEQ